MRKHLSAVTVICFYAIANIHAESRKIEYEYNSIGPPTRTTVTENGKKTVTRLDDNVIRGADGRIVRRGGELPKTDKESIAPRTCRSGPYQIREQLLTEYPYGGGVRTVSEDGRNIAYMVKRPGELLANQLIVGGKKVDHIKNPGFMYFNGDGSIMMGSSHGDGYSQLVLNEKVYPDIFVNDLPDVFFTPDCQHVAFVGAVSGEAWIFVDQNKVLKTLTNGHAKLVAVSPDAKRFAYEWDDTGARRKFMVVDNVELRDAGLLMLDFFRFSADSKHYAFVGDTGRYAYSMTLDGKIVSEQLKNMGPPVLSPVGGRVAYVSRISNTEVYTVIDNERGPTYRSVSEPVFSGDGKQAAYVASDATGSFVVLNGKPGTKYQSIAHDLCFAGPGQALVYIATENGKQHLVVDGKKTRSFDKIQHLITSDNGRALAYFAHDGKSWNMVLNNGTPAPSPDPVFETLTISPDCRHTACVVNVGGDKAVVVDGNVGPTYMVLFAKRIHFDAKGGVEYLAARNFHLYRVTHTR